MVVYKIRLLQETLKFHILADNFPGEDVDFRAYVISVRIVTGNDFFVSVKDSPAYLFQFVNGDYVMGLRTTPYLASGIVPFSATSPLLRCSTGML